jgi:Group II intron, maturase-specific domain
MGAASRDVNRRGDFPNIRFDFLGFQFRARKIMWVKADRRIFAHSFQPAASPKALTGISCEIRSWAPHHRSDKSLAELAQMYNPCLCSWITYYSRFYETQLRPTLKRIDAYVIRWARRKFKRMRHQTKGGRDWFECYAAPTQLCSPIECYAMATAGHREPWDSRRSCTVLGAPGGELRATRHLRCFLRVQARSGCPLKLTVRADVAEWPSWTIWRTANSCLSDRQEESSQPFSSIMITPAGAEGSHSVPLEWKPIIIL